VTSKDLENSLSTLHANVKTMLKTKDYKVVLGLAPTV
jgi:hypothetical protein